VCSPVLVKNKLLMAGGLEWLRYLAALAKMARMAAVPRAEPATMPAAVILY
jgi:hypothetical protein